MYTYHGIRKNTIEDRKDLVPSISHSHISHIYKVEALLDSLRTLLHPSIPAVKSCRIISNPKLTLKTQTKSLTINAVYGLSTKQQQQQPSQY